LCSGSSHTICGGLSPRLGQGSLSQILPSFMFLPLCPPSSICFLCLLAGPVFLRALWFPVAGSHLDLVAAAAAWSSHPESPRTFAAASSSLRTFLGPRLSPPAKSTLVSPYHVALSYKLPCTHLFLRVLCLLVL
jgi:hypothetical protein